MRGISGNTRREELVLERVVPWPELPPLELWLDTLETLHRWTQIAGKIRLAQTPWINHSWHVPLYVTSQGLATSPMYHGSRTFEIAFDFVDHRLHLETSAGERRSLALRAMSVAEFYDRILHALDTLGIHVRIWPVPVEIPGHVERFPDDHRHAAYDPDAVTLFWRALVQADRVFTEFRARFIGKTSPVHFFWGAFDLAVTRFSGRTAPRHPGGVPNCADWVIQEAYSHEVSSAGFWPGVGLGEAAFYSYAYPEPEDFSRRTVRPEAARYHTALREFILPYEAVRTARDPDVALMTFLESTYATAAELAHWERSSLERTLTPKPRLH